jgi:hypothetical protein
MRIARDERAPKTWRDRARESIADDDWAHGHAEDAVAVYRDLAAEILNEDAARVVEVKAIAAADPAAERAVVDVLVGAPGRGIDPWLGGLSLGMWAGGSFDALASYLVAKNLVSHEDWTRASSWLDRSLQTPMLTARIGRELLRAKAISACVLGDSRSLANVRGALDGPDSPFAHSSGGRREWLRGLIERCDRD